MKGREPKIENAKTRSMTLETTGVTTFPVM
jgi:hypothetical protein